MSRWQPRFFAIVSLAVMFTGLLAAPAQADEPTAQPASDPAAQSGTYYAADGVYRTPPGVSFAPDRVLVKFRAGASGLQKVSAVQSVEASVGQAFTLVPGLQVLELSKAGRANVVDATATLSQRPDVEYAMPDFTYQLTVDPNDPSYSGQWALPAIGAPAAWARSTGSATVTVAILDTGVDLDHPDLVANLVPGWNFVAGNATPQDDNGHGTHVAGIIGAVGNNSIGVSGVNWSVSLMPLKICDQYGSCSLSSEISALQYAVAHGARVANASFGAANGGYAPERDAIAAAGAAGLLYVAAAGNNASNTDADPFYPADYPLDNIIAVGASSPSDTLSSFSNYGQASVDLIAPGESILSTVPDGYDYLSGTSMAAPQVTGAAALIESLYPTWTPQKVRKQLIGSATPVAGLEGKAVSCGRLNLDAATDPAIAIRSALCVTRSGSGLGSVTSSPAAIDCGTTCSALLARNTKITLTATPSAGYAFGGWTGACSGSSTCAVTLAASTTVGATFIDPASQGGWSNALLKPPSGRNPLPSGMATSQWTSFFNVALSANGKVRAKTIYDQPSGWCYYATSDTGGVSMEHKTSSGWVSDGVITAPSLGPLPSDRWMNCAGFGTVTELSGDGSTLVVGADSFFNRCVAFVYRRSADGWSLDGTLYPEGANAQGSSNPAKCAGFAQEGAISFTGDRVAIYSPEPYVDLYRPRVDIFVRGSSGWARERSILTPLAAGCASWPDGTGEHRLAMSGDGGTILVGDPFCKDGIGRVYHYTHAGSVWSRMPIVANPDPVSGRWFGRSVAISADGLTAALGLTYEIGQPDSVSTSWVYELSGGLWTKRTRLEPGIADPESWFACTSLVRAGQRIVCAMHETHGFNDEQGSIYVFDRPAAGWSSGSTPTRLFARSGHAFDWVGAASNWWRSDPAVNENGTLIDATIIPFSLALGNYNDRIGYEFRR